MTCAYVRTIERWREVLVLAPTPNERTNLTTHERATNGCSKASEIWDGDDCSEEPTSRKTQMNVIIQKLDGLWHLVVGSCQIRTPFLETQDREWVVAYARRIYPGAKVFERD